MTGNVSIADEVGGVTELEAGARANIREKDGRGGGISKWLRVVLGWAAMHYIELDGLGAGWLAVRFDGTESWMLCGYAGLVLFLRALIRTPPRSEGLG